MDFAASSFDYVNQNTLHPLGLAALAVACALIALGPVRAILLVLVGLSVYIPSAQRLVLGGGVTTSRALAVLASVPGVRYVEPNYLVPPAVVSNDPYYLSGTSPLWGMHGDAIAPNASERTWEYHDVLEGGSVFDARTLKCQSG